MPKHPVFDASMLQPCDQSIPLQTTATPVESDEEYKVEDPRQEDR